MDRWMSDNVAVVDDEDDGDGSDDDDDNDDDGKLRINLLYKHS